jgi:hypothetical protein
MAGSVFHRGTVFSRQLDIDASGNATVSGNLTVDGSTTTISTTNTVIKDKLIELGNGVTGTPSGDAGIIIERGSSANATIIWDESADTFVVGTTSATGASSGNLTVTDAALQAASLDISGNIDIDGTSNLDAVDIDGAVQIDNTLTVGVDDTGYDVKFFGDTASAYMQWDASEDDLILGGAARAVVPEGQLVLGSTAVTATAAELNLLDGVSGLVQADLTKLAAVDASAAEINAVADASGRTAAAIAVADDHFMFLDGGATGDVKVESIADFVAAIAGSNLSASNGVLAASAGSTDLNGLSAAVVDVAADSIGFVDANDSNNSKKESIADLMTAVAGSQATTGLTASSGTLVVTDLHPVGVSGSANQLLTDDGDGTVTSEAKAKVDGATMTIGNGTAEDAMLAFDGNAQDFRIGLDDGTDVLEIGHGTTMGTNTAISVNSSGQVTAFNIPAAAVAQASDHIIFLDGGATGAPKAESIDDFLTAIAGSGISVSSSQLTASGGAIDLNGLSAAVVDVAADSIAIIDANDSNASRKESIADFCSAIAGTAVSSSNGVLNVDVGAAATGLANNDSLPGGAASSADQIIAIQVFS